jgi:hypothetical protein
MNNQDLLGQLNTDLAPITFVTISSVVVNGNYLTITAESAKRVDYTVVIKDGTVVKTRKAPPRLNFTLVEKTRAKKERRS